MPGSRSSVGSDRRGGVVVELCGLPGAGKTVLAEALVAELRRRGIPARDASFAAGRAARWTRLARKAGLVALGAVAEPTAAARSARAVRQAGVSRREVVARTVNLMASRRLATDAARAPGVTVIDQGVVQELGSVAMTGDLDRAAAALPPGYMATDLVVVVHVDPDEAARRLGRRASGESRLERFTGDALVDELAAHAVRLDEVVRRAVEGPVRRVDHADGRTAQAAIEVADAAEEALNRCGATPSRWRRLRPTRRDRW